MNWLTSIRRGRADNSVNWHTIVDALVQALEEKPIDAGGGNKHRLQGTGHGDSAIATKAVSTEPERWCLELWKGRAVWICWWLLLQLQYEGCLSPPRQRNPHTPECSQRRRRKAGGRRKMEIMVMMKGFVQWIMLLTLHGSAMSHVLARHGCIGWQENKSWHFHALGVGWLIPFDAYRDPRAPPPKPCGFWRLREERRSKHFSKGKTKTGTLTHTHTHTQKQLRVEREAWHS